MEKYRIILSDNDKLIVQNYYINKNRKNSAIQYKEWLVSQFLSLGLENPFEDKNSLKYEHIAIDWIWDEQSNKSMVSHILQNIGMGFSNKRKKDFFHLHIDKEALDNSGKNFLMYAALNSNFKNEFCNDDFFDSDTFIDLNVKDMKDVFDKDGNSVYFYLLKSFDFESYKNDIIKLKKSYEDYKKNGVKSYDISNVYQIVHNVYKPIEFFGISLKKINENKLTLRLNRDEDDLFFLREKSSQAVEFMSMFSQEVQKIPDLKKRTVVIGMQQREDNYMNIEKLFSYYNLNVGLNNKMGNKKKVKL